MANIFSKIAKKGKQFINYTSQVAQGYEEGGVAGAAASGLANLGSRPKGGGDAAPSPTTGGGDGKIFGLDPIIVIVGAAAAVLLLIARKK